MVSDEPQNPTYGASMVQIQVQLGTLQGTINTLLTALGNRMTTNEEATKQLRTDLTAVKDNGTRELNIVNNSVTQNTSAINDLKTDMAEVKEKQNSATQRAVLVLSPVIAIAGLLWGIFGDKA